MAEQQSMYDPGSGSSITGHGFDVRWRHYYPQLAIHSVPHAQLLAQAPHQLYNDPQQQAVHRQHPSQVRLWTEVTVSGY